MTWPIRSSTARPAVPVYGALVSHWRKRASRTSWSMCRSAPIGKSRTSRASPSPRFPLSNMTALRYETQAIMRYVDERFAGMPLQPEDVHEWSRMNQIIGIVDAYAGPSIAGTILFNRILVPRLLGGTPDEAAIAAALPRARLCLAEIDRLMEDHRFLTGDHVSLGDLMVIPLLYYFSNIPDGLAPMAEHPKLQNWVR